MSDHPPSRPLRLLAGLLLVLAFAAGIAAASEDARSFSVFDGAAVRAVSARALPARAVPDLPHLVPLPGCGAPPPLHGPRVGIASRSAADAAPPVRRAVHRPALARPPPAVPQLRRSQRADAVRAPSHS